MKIITNDGVYVQKNDIAYLNHTDLPIPASIFTKVFVDDIVIISDHNRYEFIKFEETHEIDFFQKLDWIVDYNALKDLTDDEIIALGQGVAEEKNNIAKKYNAMTESERRKNQNIVHRCELLDYKMYSLRDVLWYKQGHLKFQLPDGLDNPQNIRVAEEKGLRRILRKFKK